MTLIFDLQQITSEKCRRAKYVSALCAMEASTEHWQKQWHSLIQWTFLVELDVCISFDNLKYFHFAVCPCSPKPPIAHTCCNLRKPNVQLLARHGGSPHRAQLRQEDFSELEASLDYLGHSGQWASELGPITKQTNKKKSKKWGKVLFIFRRSFHFTKSSNFL